MSIATVVGVLAVIAGAVAVCAAGPALLFVGVTAGRCQRDGVVLAYWSPRGERG